MKSLSLIALVFAVFVSAASAQDTSTISKTQEFLDSKVTAKYALGFCHMGAQYRSHAFDYVAGVKDSLGNKIHGEFALVYRFVWDAGGRGDTTIGFLCNKQGRVESVRVIKSTGIVNSPFTIADATIKLLGQAMLEAFREHISSSEARKIEGLIRSANSRGLLEVGLGIRQTLNIH